MNHSMKPLKSFCVLSGFQMLSYLAIKIITGKGTKKDIEAGAGLLHFQCLCECFHSWRVLLALVYIVLHLLWLCCATVTAGQLASTLPSACSSTGCTMPHLDTTEDYIQHYLLVCTPR